MLFIEFLRKYLGLSSKEVSHYPADASCDNILINFYEAKIQRDYGVVFTRLIDVAFGLT